jgi:predicted ester cyclase
MANVGQNKAVARRFFEVVWNQRRLEVLPEILASTLIWNGQQVSRDVIEQAISARLAAFPDMHVTVDEQVAEGDKVSTRRTWTGTHSGVYRGIEPTGKQATWTQISIVRFEEGKVVEDWAVADELALLQQLGHSVEW